MNTLLRKNGFLTTYRSLALISIRTFARVAEDNSVFKSSKKLNEPNIIVKANKNIGTILLNRPKALNALNMDIVKTLKSSIKEWEKSNKINMILFKGEGKALCSGGDIKFFVEVSKDPSKFCELLEFTDTIYQTILDITIMETPVISIMNGITMGGGLSLSAASHFSVATENSRICMPETRIGHFCDAGSSYFLPRLNNNIGKYMALCSYTLKAEDVLFSGLATHFIPSDRLQNLEDSLAKLTNPSLDAINNTIESFSLNDKEFFSDSSITGENRLIINECFKYNTVEEIISALKQNGSKFCIDTIEEMRKSCPIGVKLTLEQFKRGAKLSLNQSMQMELKSWQVSARQPDFQEGISSTLSKTQPKWANKNFSDVDFEKDIIQKYLHTSIKSRSWLIDLDDHQHKSSFHRQFRLPSEEEVKYAFDKIKIKEDVVKHFVKVRNNKYGVKKEVEEVLRCV